MANQVIYKHPDATEVVQVDFEEDLLSDGGLANTSSVNSTNWAGGIASVATLTTATTSLECSIQFAGGVDGDDYKTTLKGVGQTTGQVAVRVFELRVRANHGIGLK